MVSARESLRQLQEGNLRFASNVRGSDAFVSHTRRVELTAGQQPIEGLLSTHLVNDPEALVRSAVRANINASVDHLRHGSPVLEQLIRGDGLLVVGAEYSLDTGLVEFFES
jgi:carbonic anhydrase